MHRTTPRFWRRFEELPEPIRKTAQQKIQLLKRDPRHPSLHFKKIGKLWSVRVGRNHRALAVEDGEDFLWGWIGTHDEYERIIKEMG
ncbi:MAG: hypothetical protein FJ279_06050 [Planctomycetes bacterium]|nr:hypothetical protein [Planctomycetota bacterium]MBM4078565.1 hypothetical protein [Planctomycetota bacterium]